MIATQPQTFNPNPAPQLEIPSAVTALQLKMDFEKLHGTRSHIEHRWYDYAGWTLPYLYLMNESESTTEMQHDYQSVGAQATNHLANKIVTVLFPQGRPFFRMDISAEQKEELIAMDLSVAQIDEILSLAEKESMKGLAKAHLRTAMLEAIKALIVLGNSLIYIPKADDNNARAQVYSLKDYVILRDMSGIPYKIITRDSHVVATLPEDIRTLVVAQTEQAVNPDDVVHIYTGIQRNRQGKFIVWQEIDSMFRAPRKVGNYAEDDLPWIPLTWNLARGYNYGTGLVEEYAGDFHTYSSLSEALVNLAAIVSDIKILVDPMGQTDVETLNDSPSGTYVYGNADDISYLQLEKFQDMKFLHDQMETYSRRIGAGFLFNSAVTRNAERVTAEEIRMQANELEGSLGGVYGRLSEELQLPLAKRAVRNMGATFKGIEPTIITGMESLSRTSELDDIMLFFRDLAMLADLPEPIQERLDYGDVISKLGSARRVEYKTFLLDEETVTQNRKTKLAQEQAAANTQANANAQAQPQPEETF